jgi:hypothetical protein
VNPTGKSARASFAKLLSEHLTKGSHPATMAGEPWSYAAFAAEVKSSRESGESDFVSPRSPSNWCRGRSLPAEIEPILRALFGPATSPSYRRADADALREAYRTARDEKYAAVIAALYQVNAGQGDLTGAPAFQNRAAARPRTHALPTKSPPFPASTQRHRSNQPELVPPRLSGAQALLHAGFSLGAIGRSEEAIAVYDDLLARFGTPPSRPCANRSLSRFATRG